MSDTRERDPGERWLECLNCETEWDDTQELGDFEAQTDCPECGGTVIRVFRPTVGEAHKYARARRKLSKTVQEELNEQ